MSNQKGSRTERELVQLLDAAGFAVIRAPASGGATDRDLPDVLAGNGREFYAVEAKSSGSDHIYLTGEEVESLVYFATNFGAKSRIGVRFDGEDWYFFHPSDLYTTKSGNYRVKKERALTDGVSLEDLTAGSSGGVRSSSDEDSGVKSVLHAVRSGDITVDEAIDVLDL